jgi:hypothetical protein
VQGVAPAQYSLDSGQWQAVQVEVDVPAGTAPGNYAVNIVATAPVPGCSGLCFGAGVAGTLELHVS